MTFSLRYSYLANFTSAARNDGPTDCAWLQTAVNWKGPYFVKQLILISLSAVHKNGLRYRQNIVIKVTILAIVLAFNFR